ncbi:hypothetical protein KCP77_11125 [Salmonella enterica subsp. enterica]|nr:hypothetical protein KCP77_11125 [Salmonella enterica subsp. enterica]
MRHYPENDPDNIIPARIIASLFGTFDNKPFDAQPNWRLVPKAKNAGSKCARSGTLTAKFYVVQHVAITVNES